MIGRIWTGHRALVAAAGVIAVVAIIVASLLLVAASGGISQAGATPGATATDISPTPSDTPTPFASPTPTVSPTPSPSPTPTVNPGPTPLPAGMAYADLDGVATTVALAHRLPMAIMIDDTAAARPQSGMSLASIVYQAPADGAVDRYMMVFQEGTAVASDKQNSAIGPVRSTRPYYVYWADEYRALLGHFGGDRKSRLQVIPENAGYIYNMDGIARPCAYHRITTRIRPHNAYTSTAALLKCAARKGYPATYQNAPTRPFTGDTSPALRPAAQSITIAYPTEKIGYQFNPATDSYLRLVNGVAEIDPANNQQVFARSIVVLYQKLSVDYSEPNHARPVVANVGHGKAIVFQEGKAITATWKKDSNSALTRFYDFTGKEIQLVRGEIFIQSIPASYKVTTT